MYLGQLVSGQGQISKIDAEYAVCWIGVAFRGTELRFLLLFLENEKCGK
jgi:hypothetical protein